MCILAYLKMDRVIILKLNQMTRYITLGSIGINLVKIKALNSFSSPHTPRFARADGGR